MKPKTNNTVYLVLLASMWIGCAAISRLIPHPFNATAIISLAVWAPRFFKTTFGGIITIISLLVSDLTLHFVHHYPMFGSWSLFTYSGALLLVFLYRHLDQNMFLTTVIGCFAFWLWTNLGTWLTTSDLYPHSIAGLMQCYIAAIPFLKHSLISNAVYTLALSYLYQTTVVFRKQLQG